MYKLNTARRVLVAAVIALAFSVTAVAQNGNANGRVPSLTELLQGRGR
jgi:hypothetical protein